jgi:hypothetical protein
MTHATRAEAAEHASVYLVRRKKRTDFARKKLSALMERPAGWKHENVPIRYGESRVNGKSFATRQLLGKSERETKSFHAEEPGASPVFLGFLFCHPERSGESVRALTREKGSIAVVPKIYVHITVISRLFYIHLSVRPRFLRGADERDAMSSSSYWRAELARRSLGLPNSAQIDQYSPIQ